MSLAVLLIISLIFLGIGFFSFRKSYKLVKNGNKVQAKIVDVSVTVEHDTDEDGYTSTHKAYAPIFEFVASNGETYSVKSENKTNRKRKYKVGNVLNVVYDKDDPDKAEINSFGALWLAPSVITFVGIIFLIMAFVAEF